MRKRALKKKRGELEALLADRREALGELVLGMHVRQGWDEDLMARGAAEVREVEESLAAVDEELGEGAGTVDDGDDRAVGREEASDLPEQPTFETAEHTMEHDLPDEDSEPTGAETAAATGLAAAAAAEESVPAVKPKSPKGAASVARPTEPTPGEGQGDRAGTESTEPPSESRPGADHVPPAPAEPRVPPAGADEEAAGRREAPSVPGSKPVGEPEKPETVKESPLDRLAARLDSEEKEARTGVEAARAAATADTRTETSAILESVERDRSELQAALAAAAGRIRAAEKRAEEAEAAVARREAENREAAAGWVRSQAAEIEADAALASEIAATEAPAGPGGGDTAALEAEIANLKAAVETEREQKATAIAAAEARLREIESKAREAETRLSEAPVPETDSPSGAEMREAAVDWLRGQIAALKREIESSSERSGD